MKRNVCTKFLKGKKKKKKKRSMIAKLTAKYSRNSPTNTTEIFISADSNVSFQITQI